MTTERWARGRRDLPGHVGGRTHEVRPRLTWLGLLGLVIGAVVIGTGIVIGSGCSTPSACS